MQLEDLIIYQKSMGIADNIWHEVSAWKYFERDTLGKQWVRAADSIAANISEGFGRYYFKENKQFLYYARGSLQETRTWLSKAFNRKLISGETHRHLYQELETLSPKLNNYIRSIGPQPGQVKEDSPPYPFQEDMLTDDSMKNATTESPK
jgi:four helix bundle protein